MADDFLFKLIDDISQKKVGLLNTPITGKNPSKYDPELFDKQYNVATMNKALGSHPDALFLLDALNKKGGSKLFHHEILMMMLPSRIRRGKWVKEIPDKSIEIISEYYGVRGEVASQYKRFITDDELKLMKERNEENNK